MTVWQRVPVWMLFAFAACASAAAPPSGKAIVSAPQPKAADTLAADEVRLYALDCGRIDESSFGGYSDTGEYDGRPRTMSAPCFVIRHPRGVLLWDAGLGDRYADAKGGVDEAGTHLSVSVRLVDQLQAIGLTPAGVGFVAFSHLHADHTGNANLFGRSTFLMNAKEIAWASATPTPAGVDPATFSVYESANKQVIERDHDVFGDGRVLILRAPGHTPGHQVLLLRLKKAGVVILSGDLYHARESRQFRRVPAFNDSRADTLAYMDRIETIVGNLHARFVIQHDPADFAALPKFPAYLN
ncbi:N-acyl homoserine lactonase family protein [Rudaea sp.]|uniref:N-acyl homoserine lactonase family protein n=1 Tax=Rudaea sp. TaxID=2136325 RepID=UPI003220085B